MQPFLDSKTHVLFSNFDSLEAGMHLIIVSGGTFQWATKGVSCDDLFFISILKLTVYLICASGKSFALVGLYSNDLNVKLSP